MSVLYQDLVGLARKPSAKGCIVDTDSRSHHTIYRAVVERGDAVYRAEIDTVDDREKYDSDPRVSFSKCHPSSEVDVQRQWTPLATGSLYGPQDLKDWQALFETFEAAKKAYDKDRNVSDSGGNNAN